MYDMAHIRWRLFVAWLASDCAGLLPALFCLMPEGPVLPLARQNAAAVGSWVLALLAERGRRSARPRLTLKGEALPLHAFTAGDLSAQLPWLRRTLAAELLRLVQVTVAARITPCLPGWLEWEARYWALAVTLSRLGQLYGLLERERGREPAQQVLAEVAAQVWQQAVGAA